MKFKQLEIEPESNWFRRTFWKKHTIKSIIYIVLGAAAGLLYFYFTEGKHMDTIASGDILKSMLIGGFFGFFITNSPCARGRC
jgi:RsiW-degrading membrane proteinase PrsW (M82 family)